MMTVALGLSLAAIYWYPWPSPSVTHAKVGEKLFDELSSNDVRWIELEQFDPNLGAIERLSLKFENNQWTIPERAGYPAGNVALRTSLLNTMNGLEIFDVPSEDRKDHSLYGVLEPNDDSITGQGFLISLKDRNREPIASLIVGKSPENFPEKRSVRIPGQSQIYAVDFDPRVLTTNFNDWIDRNLLRFGTSTRPRSQLQYLRINRYSLDSQALMSGEVQRDNVYRAQLAFDSEQPTLTLSLPDEEGSWGDYGASRNVPGAWYSRLEQALLVTDIIGIKPKQDVVASHLLDQQPAPPLEFSSMASSGFQYDDYLDGQHRFLGAAGSIEICRQDGLLQTVYFGRLADVGQSDSGELSRYMLVVAGIDESVFPQPTPPETDDEDAQQNYQRQVNARNDRLDDARERAEILNKQYHRWYYIIPESQYEVYAPPLTQVQ